MEVDSTSVDLTVDQSCDQIADVLKIITMVENECSPEVQGVSYEYLSVIENILRNIPTIMEMGMVMEVMKIKIQVAVL